jgi:hypothetical protein
MAAVAVAVVAVAAGGEGELAKKAITCAGPSVRQRDATNRQTIDVLMSTAGSEWQCVRGDKARQGIY